MIGFFHLPAFGQHAEVLVYAAYEPVSVFSFQVCFHVICLFLYFLLLSRFGLALLYMFLGVAILFLVFFFFFFILILLRSANWLITLSFFRLWFTLDFHDFLQILSQLPVLPFLSPLNLKVRLNFIFLPFLISLTLVFHYLQCRFRCKKGASLRALFRGRFLPTFHTGKYLFQFLIDIDLLFLRMDLNSECVLSIEIGQLDCFLFIEFLLLGCLRYGCEVGGRELLLVLIVFQLARVMEKIVFEIGPMLYELYLIWR